MTDTVEMMGRVTDVCNGAALILQMIERSMIDRMAEKEPLLNDRHQEVLINMAVASLKLLGESAAAEISRINNLEKNGGLHD